MMFLAFVVGAVLLVAIVLVGVTAVVSLIRWLLTAAIGLA
jgi:hypothetical protein